MEKDETVEILLLNSISNDAFVVGKKKYKEKKLVKKFSRCLPSSFEANKAVLKVFLP